MSYDDIYRSWERIRKAMEEGNERDRENLRKIMRDCERTEKTIQGYIRELCEKIRTDNENEFRKLDNSKTDDLERWIILTKFLGTYGLLGLTGYVPSFLQRKYYERVKKRKK